MTPRLDATDAAFADTVRRLSFSCPSLSVSFCRLLSDA